MTTPQFSVDRKRRPVATYRAISTKDAASVQRDGEAVLEIRELASQGESAEAEVLFADGQWLLCDPTRDLVPGFIFDAFPEHPFLAEAYGETWNGWDTPVVRREVLADILTALELSHRWEGDVTVLEVDDYEDRIVPRLDGLYDLQQAGWTVQQVELG